VLHRANLLDDDEHERVQKTLDALPTTYAAVSFVRRSMTKMCIRRSSAACTSAWVR